MLVGLKEDLVDQYAVDPASAQEFAENLDIHLRLGFVYLFYFLQRRPGIHTEF